MRDHDYIGLAAAAWLVGLFALICDYVQPSRPLVIGMHALFGVVTCAAIALVLIPKARSMANSPPTELYLFTRLVSRWVYVLMYLLAIVRVAFNLHDTIPNCTLCGAPVGPGSPRSLEDFQFYIGCCVVPLWLVRALVLTAGLTKSPA